MTSWPSKRLGLKPGPRWTPENGARTANELTLLGTDHDEVIAKKVGRSLGALTTQRVLRKIPAFSGWPGSGPTWTKKEIRLFGTDTDAALAKQNGRRSPRTQVPGFALCSAIRLLLSAATVIIMRAV